MAEIVNLNELLQKMQVTDNGSIQSPMVVNKITKQEIREKVAEERPTLRPLRFICNEIVRAMENPNVEEGSKKLKHLKEELKIGKGTNKISQQFSLPPSAHPSLTQLFKTQMERVNATDRMNQKYVSAIADLMQSIKGVRSKTENMYKKKATNIHKLENTWNKRCLLYTSPSPRDVEESRMPSSA